MIKNILKSLPNIDTFLYSDNRNLVNAVYSSTNLEDKRLVLDISILRDMIERRELTELKWVATDQQLADVFTKQGASCKLLLNVMNNHTLRFDKSSGNFGWFFLFCVAFPFSLLLNFRIKLFCYFQLKKKEEAMLVDVIVMFSNMCLCSLQTHAWTVIKVLFVNIRLCTSGHC